MDIICFIIYVCNKDWKGFLIIDIIGDLIIGIWALCSQGCCTNKNSMLTRKVIMKKCGFSSNINPAGNIKCFSNLSDEDRGVYLETVTWGRIKIINLTQDDTIVDASVIEINKCFESLKSPNLVPTY